jgi:hypothetical protein
MKEKFPEEKEPVKFQCAERDLSKIYPWYYVPLASVSSTCQHGSHLVSVINPQYKIKYPSAHFLSCDTKMHIGQVIVQIVELTRKTKKSCVPYVHRCRHASHAATHAFSTTVGHCLKTGGSLAGARPSLSCLAASVDLRPMWVACPIQSAERAATCRDGWWVMPTVLRWIQTEPLPLSHWPTVGDVWRRLWALSCWRRRF